MFQDKVPMRLVLAGFCGLLSFAPSARGQCEVDMFTQQPPGATQWHGFNVAISGDGAVALSRTGFGSSTQPGLVTVYRRSGADWAEEAVLTVPNGSVTGIPHMILSMSGDVIAAGAPTSPVEPGRAHIYRFDGAQWNLEQTIFPPAFSIPSFFSDAIAVDGDDLVIGDFSASIFGLPAVGTAFAYRFDGGSGQWVFQQQINASDIGIADIFGAAIAVDQGAMIVGAPFKFGAGPNSGAAYVFRFTGGMWVQEAKLVPSDSGGFDIFGWSVDLDGRVAIVGAPSDTGPGAAYVFRFDGVSWNEEAKLTTSSASAAELGNAVSVDGNVALVGDPEDGGGAAHVFIFDGTTWGPEATVAASDTQAGALYGWALDMDGNSAIVGAPFHDESLGDQGKVYFLGGLDDADCNANGVPDSCDIEAGTSTDDNGNGIPDDCEVPTCNGVPATIFVRNGIVVGGPLDSQVFQGVLIGTEGDDVIVGTGGEDTIIAVGGDDTICAGGGDDLIIGGPGFDVIDGGDGIDRCVLGDSNVNCEIEL